MSPKPQQCPSRRSTRTWSLLDRFAHGSTTFAMALIMGCTRPTPASDILLVTIDTLRADALGAYGASPCVTPFLDDLATRCRRGDEVMSMAPLTRPAHSTLLTGLWPTSHGIHDNGSRNRPSLGPATR